ncbi:amidase [Leptolyngbya sp. AN02str]|uniref:amidase n=1 Tax=Leptolyngbya sp. AN02str TaxID=3423363 RepID=UPI003D31F08F
MDLTELYLQRIEQLNPLLGSYFTVLADYALEDAATKTEALANLGANADPLPPFFGVPISIKDLTPMAGVPCSYGIKALRDRMATEDAGVVTKIQQAGFVVLGKTATSELGATPYTEPKGFAPARNPWNVDYTPGGSSGGAAAAVAAGLCPVAHGSDGGGSIRGPASCCGLVGIKPSRGLVSHAPIGDKLSGLAMDGPIARTVADAAALLDAMSGPIAGDPYWLPTPEQPFVTAVNQPIKPLRIGFLTALPPMGEFDPLCKKAVMETVQLLEEMGHRAEQITLDMTDLVKPLITVWQAGVDMGVPWFLMSRLNRWLLKRSRRNSGGVYLRAVMQMQAIARRIVTQLQDLDALVLPVYMHPTIRVGEWKRLRTAQMFDKIVHWVAPCPPFNATGQPAIAIPTGFTPNGLPIGIQLVGQPANDMTIIAIAAQIEAARPWSQHRPAIAVEGEEGSRE